MKQVQIVLVLAVLIFGATALGQGPNHAAAASAPELQQSQQSPAPRIVDLKAPMAVLISTGAVSGQQVASGGSAPADIVYARPGQLVDAGGFRLNLYCMGSGSPTVVFDSGWEDWAPAWAKVQPEIAKWTRACSYDRAGAGFSEPGPMPRTSERIAEELHMALHNAGIGGPYILAGAAFGAGAFLVLKSPSNFSISDRSASKTRSSRCPINFPLLPGSVNEESDATFTVSSPTVLSQPITVSYSMRGTALRGMITR